MNNGEASHGTTDNHYDAIVVGTGPSGATVAYELARGGLRTLVLDKGEAAALQDVWRRHHLQGCQGTALQYRACNRAHPPQD